MLAFQAGLFDGYIGGKYSMVIAESGEARGWFKFGEAFFLCVGRFDRSHRHSFLHMYHTRVHSRQQIISTTRPLLLGWEGSLRLRSSSWLIVAGVASNICLMLLQLCITSLGIFTISRVYNFLAGLKVSLHLRMPERC